MRREQIERFLASGDITVEDWCKRERVSESCFYRWLAVFREEEPELFGGSGRSPVSQTDWIELSRREVAETRALAVVDRPAPPEPADVAGRGGDDADARAAGAPPSGGGAVRIRLNGACVEVPGDADLSRLGAILRAVAAL